MIQITLNNADAYFQRGMSRCRLENYQEGIEDLFQVIQLEPDNEAAYFCQGIFHRQLGDNLLGIQQRKHPLPSIKLL